MAFILDERLREYATDQQWQKLQAIEKYGSERKAAEALGCGSSSVSRAKVAVERNAARHGVAPDYGWQHPVPPGFQVSGVSTLRDLRSGEAVMEWQKTTRDGEAQAAAMREAVDALCEEIKPCKPVKGPATTSDNLMSVYPVGDHHIGCLAWAEETDGKNNYDTAESERLLIAAMDYLVEASPNSDTGLFILMGDLLHYDNYATLTQSGHMLDSDSRYPRLVRAAMKAVRHGISAALTKHKLVRVIVSAGNHDPSSMVFLREALHTLYENEPRVEIDRSPKLFHYYRFGLCLIGVHHGDKVKMAQMPLIMAVDAAEDWGQCEHRIVLTGHVHHDSVKDFPGVRVESVRVLAPADAWAYGMGYRSKRDMKRIDFHKEYGEVARQLVTPEMAS